jgi:hypothetical protein
MKLRDLFNENNQNKKKQAQLEFEKYKRIVSKFKPSGIKYAGGYNRDTYYIELHVPDEFENPALMIEFSTNVADGRDYSQAPLDRVMINVWTKVNSEKYKEAILKLFQILSSVDPNMPVLWDEDDLDGTVKKWSNKKLLDTRF